MINIQEMMTLLRKARDFIEFSPLMGAPTTNLVGELDEALASVPRTEMWMPKFDGTRCEGIDRMDVNQGVR